MILLLLPLAVTLAQDPGVQSPKYSEPLSDQATLSLSAERGVYYSRETMRLRLSLRNVSENALVGIFDIAPLSPTTILYYRRNGGEYFRFYRRPEAGYIERIREVQPGEEVSGEKYVAFDTGRQEFVLDEPGIYEFKVVYADAPGIRNARMESDVATVEVAAPPAKERAAAQSYSRDVAMMTQDGLLVYGALPWHVAQCRRFLEMFPGSVYAGPVRAALTRSLSYKIRRNKATEEEKEVYERLRAEPHEP